MMTLYHVTFTKHLATIWCMGLVPGISGPTWQQAGSGEGYGSPHHVFAFEDRDDAIRWASLQDWDFHQATGSRQVAVVEFDDDSEWDHDDADPLRRLGSLGRWLKRKGRVEPSQLRASFVVTSSIIKESFAKGRAA